MKEAVFTLKLEAELRDAFMAEAEASHRPASQIVRDFMREFIKTQQDQRDYDVWLDAELEKAVREADDPNTVFEQIQRRANTPQMEISPYLGEAYTVLYEDR